MSAPMTRLVTRFLALDDIPALLQLEIKQWKDHQAADAQTLRQRIESQPQLCIGSFCARTGRALASLFMRPISRDEIRQARRWADCAVGQSQSSADRRADSLFGISLTSVSPAAASALFEFFWPHALKAGWREIYLGSPIPGLVRALNAEPGLDVETYVHSRRGGLPRDAQLRYYHRKGFKQIVAVLPEYFPHEASRNYGVLLRGKVPLSTSLPIWGLMPRRLMNAVLKCLMSVSGVCVGTAKPSVLEGAQ